MNDDIIFEAQKLCKNNNTKSPIMKSLPTNALAENWKKKNSKQNMFVRKR